jgi:hypothetical protein
VLFGAVDWNVSEYSAKKGSGMIAGFRLGSCRPRLAWKPIFQGAAMVTGLKTWSKMVSKLRNSVLATLSEPLPPFRELFVG